MSDYKSDVRKSDSNNRNDRGDRSPVDNCGCFHVVDACGCRVVDPCGCFVNQCCC